MEIIIKIPKEIYTGEQTAGILPIVVDAIGKGIPLPEHHGRLIDADWVKNTLDIYVINEYNGQFIRRNDIDTVPTIIEGSDSE